MIGPNFGPNSWKRAQLLAAQIVEVRRFEVGAPFNYHQISYSWRLSKLILAESDCSRWLGLRQKWQVGHFMRCCCYCIWASKLKVHCSFPRTHFCPKLLRQKFGWSFRWWPLRRANAPYFASDGQKKSVRLRNSTTLTCWLLGYRHWPLAWWHQQRHSEFHSLTYFDAGW